MLTPEHLTSLIKTHIQEPAPLRAPGREDAVRAWDRRERGSGSGAAGAGSAVPADSSPASLHPFPSGSSPPLQLAKSSLPQPELFGEVCGTLLSSPAMSSFPASFSLKSSPCVRTLAEFCALLPETGALPQRARAHRHAGAIPS